MRPLLKPFAIIALAALLAWPLQYFKFGQELNWDLNLLMQALLPRPASPQVVALAPLSQDDGLYFTEPNYYNLANLLKPLLEQQPLAVISAFPMTTTNIPAQEMQDFVEFAGRYPNLYFYSPTTPGEEENLRRHPIFKDLQQIFVPLTQDGGSVRRIIFSMETEEGWINHPLLDLLNRVGIARDAAQFPAFDFGPSRQGYIRYRPLADQNLKPIRLALADAKFLRGKLVVVGPDINKEDPGERGQSAYNVITPGWSTTLTAGQHIALELHTFIQRDSLNASSPTTRFVLIFALVAAYLLGIVYFSVVAGFVWGFVCMVAVLVISFVSFYFFDLYVALLPSGIAIGLGHFVTSSVLLTRFLRTRDRLLAEQQQRLEIQRVQSELLVKSARADQGLKIATQVAHDIRSPLSAIRLATQRSAKDMNSDARDLILMSVQRLQSIADDLLLKFRSDDFSEEKTEAVINFNDFFNRLGDGYRASWERLDLKVQGDPDFCLTINQQVDFERAICNLLNNSLEASGQAPVQITLRHEEVADGIEVHVSDNGPGIPRDRLEKVFERGASFDKKGGSGLGLAQVRETLQKMGGTALALPVERGAHFVLQIPRRHKDGGVLRVHRQMVVAEDNPRVRERWLAKLKAAGCEVQVVSRPEEFRSLKLREPFTLLTDLIFADSDLNGFNLLEECQQRYRGTRILCTSLSGNADIHRMGLRWADRVLSKTEFERMEVVAD